jgi:hypothetical protein
MYCHSIVNGFSRGYSPDGVAEMLGSINSATLRGAARPRNAGLAIALSRLLCITFTVTTAVVLLRVCASLDTDLALACSFRKSRHRHT